MIYLTQICEVLNERLSGVSQLRRQLAHKLTRTTLITRDIITAVINIKNKAKTIICILVWTRTQT
jgi:hypothetical protein